MLCHRDTVGWPRRGLSREVFERASHPINDALLVLAASLAWNGSAIVRALASSLTGHMPSANP